MIHVTCRLTAKNRDQLRNPTLGNRLLATLAFYVATDDLARTFRGLYVSVLGTQVSAAKRLNRSTGNGPVSRHQQITFRATLIFHLIDGLLSTTAVHEVRRAGVLTCGPATWNALPDHIRTVADSAKFRKLLKSHCFRQTFNICAFCVFFVF